MEIIIMIISKQAVDSLRISFFPSFYYKYDLFPQVAVNPQKRHLGKRLSSTDSQPAITPDLEATSHRVSNCPFSPAIRNRTALRAPFPALIRQLFQSVVDQHELP